MPPARWLLPTADLAVIDALAADLGVGRPAASVLCRRGFSSPAEARRFLRPSLDDLHDPCLLLGMREAVERLRRAITGKEKVLIYGDYDVDGTMSVVVLLTAIRMAGGEAFYHVPHRLREGYGMRAEVIEDAAAKGVSLIVSVDTGIRASEVVRRAGELGIDVIVTDHHLPEAETPPALAVLNPNRPECRYPDKNLCGAGVAFKLVQALLGSLEWPAERLRRVLDSFLKPVALATVADVVPLDGENRIIVKHGLRGLGESRNAGLRALLDVAGFSGKASPSATQVAFRIAPRINAAGRMDTAAAVIEMFLSRDPARARDIAQHLHGLNQERQQTETDIVEAILEECARAPIGDDQAALVFCGEGWHRGVLGIVASRVVERFHRPAIVLGIEQGLAQGSGRSISKFHLLDALDSMPDMFTRYGGHSHAAGLALPADKVGEFRSRFNVYALERLTAEDFVPEFEIDALLDARDLNERTAAEVFALAPFGNGNPAPLFAALDVEVAGPPALWKEKHLKVMLRSNGRSLLLKAWNFADRAPELVSGARVDVVFSLEEDMFGPPGGWSAVLRDVRSSAAGASAA